MKKLLFVLLALVGCATMYRSVLDTRDIEGVTFDSAFTRKAVAYFVEAMPNEQALCLTGEVRSDTDGTYVELIDMVPAKESTATKYSVHFYQGGDWAGCARMIGLIAFMHDHPYTPPNAPCDHSDNDALLLAGDPRVLLSMIFCQDGRGEVLMQDGRRWPFTYGGLTNPTH